MFIIINTDRQEQIRVHARVEQQKVVGNRQQQQQQQYKGKFINDQAHKGSQRERRERERERETREKVTLGDPLSLYGHKSTDKEPCEEDVLRSLSTGES